MSAPSIATYKDYVAARQQPQVWHSLLAETLTQAGLARDPQDFTLVRFSTFPTFVGVDYVVKLIGFLPEASSGFAAERKVLHSLESLSAVPDLVWAGEHSSAPGWFAIVTTKARGHALDPKANKQDFPQTMAEQLARFVQTLQAFDPAHWPQWQVPSPSEVLASLSASRLRGVSQQQIEALFSSVQLGQSLVPTHCDLWPPHLFFGHGNLSAVVDWGDACLADPAYELVQIFCNLFQLDKGLMRQFLALSGHEWYPQRMMALGLVRQVQMIRQHGAGDVFYLVPEKVIGSAKGDLRALADTLFAL